ncbi:hypothetical protein PVK06_028650 [Gossypium arboreum]|uniref:Uncharacterized protein n=1 Tax=Gossypium arboreum TaxID=29729 RepID=A0ABR0P3U5_GOSAR|nr:hypothetical protein PVK06_028650 [Gossypium arboreum]
MGYFKPKPPTTADNCSSLPTDDHRSPPNTFNNLRSSSTTVDHSMDSNLNIILNDNNHIAAYVNKDLYQIVRPRLHDPSYFLD